MVGESNQTLYLIQIDASRFAEFEISELEISRVDCINVDRIVIHLSFIPVFSLGNIIEHIQKLNYCVIDFTANLIKHGYLIIDRLAVFKNRISLSGELDIFAPRS